MRRGRRKKRERGRRGEIQGEGRRERKREGGGGGERESERKRRERRFPLINTTKEYIVREAFAASNALLDIIAHFNWRATPIPGSRSDTQRDMHTLTYSAYQKLALTIFFLENSLKLSQK